MKHTIYLSALAGVVLFACAAAFADDPFAPPWDGEPGSQYWEWADWGQFPGPMAPDDGDTSPPDGVTDVGDPYALAGAGATFLPDFAGRSNVVALGQHDDLIFHSDNYDIENPVKYVRVQITYNAFHVNSASADDSLGFGAPLGFNVWVDDGNPLFIAAQEVDATEPDNDGWLTVAYDFDLTPNPFWEEIGLKFEGYPAYVDQVVIDTWCTPEPATMALMGAGLAVVGLLRRKHR
ncbi:MAG: PEP-CTERM sorting domain-containing protein [Planctomycetia bacterium]|nr:PEP-CTERM sorting domain-containing protein [Planctomycetia bacterium]